jgi:hypothetical protein
VVIGPSHSRRGAEHIERNLRRLPEFQLPTGPRGSTIATSLSTGVAKMYDVTVSHGIAPVRLLGPKDLEE